MKQRKKRRNPWKEYEAEKAKLQRQGLSPSEYQEEIRRIAEKKKV